LWEKELSKRNMKKFIVIFILLIFFIAPALDAKYRYKYIAPREQIPVPKTKYIIPYYKPKAGQFVRPHFRAPKGSLKLYYRERI